MTDISPIVKNLIREGFRAQDAGELRRAKEYFQSAIEEAKKEKDLMGEARALLELGAINARFNKDFVMAHKQFERCLKIYTRLHSNSGCAYAMSNLGSLAIEEGQIKTALEWQNKALELFEREHDKYGTAMTLHQIGLVKSQQGDHQSAEKHWRQSLLLFESLGRNFGAGQVLLSLGALYLDYYQNPEQAKLLFLRALTLFEEAGLSYEVEKARHNLALIKDVD
jgi:tetratricopeptide (TPR) repeat protein